MLPSLLHLPRSQNFCILHFIFFLIFSHCHCLCHSVVAINGNKGNNKTAQQTEKWEHFWRAVAKFNSVLSWYRLPSVFFVRLHRLLLQYPKTHWVWVWVFVCYYCPGGSNRLSWGSGGRTLTRVHKQSPLPHTDWVSQNSVNKIVAGGSLLMLLIRRLLMLPLCLLRERYWCDMSRLRFRCWCYCLGFFWIIF